MSSRADVAEFMLKQLTDATYLRRTPGVSYARSRVLAAGRTATTY